MRVGVLAVALALLWVPAHARAGTVVIDLQANAAPCTLGQLAAAMRERFPNDSIAFGDSAADARDAVRVTFTPGDSAWTLSVEAPGNAVLQRELPAPAEACDALAQTAALIVERHLAAIAWSGATPLLEPASVVSPALPAPPSLWQAVGTAAIGGWLGTPSGGPALSVDLGVRHRVWQITAGYQMPLPSTFGLPPGDGSLQIVTGEISIAGSYRLRLPLGTLELSVVPGGGLFWGSVQGGTLFQKLPAFFIEPAVGGRVGWELALNRLFSVGIRVGGRVYVARSTFVVEGESSYETPLADGEALATLTAVVF